MVERRKYERYTMPRGTFAILRSESERLRNHAQMSIGEIAMVIYKSQPEAMWQVKDMSLGGIGIGGNTATIADAASLELDLLMADQGVYVHNIPFTVAPSESADKGAKKPAAVRSDALHFKDLDEAQKESLRELLAYHAG